MPKTDLWDIKVFLHVLKFLGPDVLILKSYSA